MQPQPNPIAYSRPSLRFYVKKETELDLPAKQSIQDVLLLGNDKCAVLTSTFILIYNLSTLKVERIRCLREFVDRKIRGLYPMNDRFYLQTSEPRYYILDENLHSTEYMPNRKHNKGYKKGDQEFYLRKGYLAHPIHQSCLREAYEKRMVRRYLESPCRFTSVIFGQIFFGAMFKSKNRATFEPYITLIALNEDLGLIMFKDSQYIYIYDCMEERTILQISDSLKSETNKQFKRLNEDFTTFVGISETKARSIGASKNRIVYCKSILDCQRKFLMHLFRHSALHQLYGGDTILRKITYLYQ